MTRRRVANILGFGGLLPFLAGGVVLAVSGARGEWARPVLAYGAVILSFIGAVHWGMALGVPGKASRRMLIGSVVPALVGWLALLTPPQTGFGLLLAGFLLWFGYERIATWDDYPDWYRTLRLRLTVAVTILLGLSWGFTILTGPSA